MTRRLESDGYARNRYRGSGRRGNPSLRTAIVDLEQAIQAATRARDVLKKAAAAPDRREREQVVQAAMEYAALAQRFLRSVTAGRLKRRKAPGSKQLRLL